MYVKLTANERVFQPAPPASTPHAASLSPSDASPVRAASHRGVSAALPSTPQPNAPPPSAAHLLSLAKLAKLLGGRPVKQKQDTNVFLQGTLTLL